MHKESKVKQMLLDLRIKKGFTRKWISEQSGVRKEYVSWASSENCKKRRGNKKDGYYFINGCPKEDMERLFKWGVANGHIK